MAAPPLEFLTGKLVSLIENELSLLGGFHAELKELKRELQTMKAFLADAQIKGVLTELEKAWVENVREVSTDVEDIMDDYNYQMNKQRSWGPYQRAFRQTICFPKNLWERHQIASKLQSIIRAIRTIRERNQCYGVDQIQGTGTSQNYDSNQVRVHGESSLFFKDDELVGIKDARERLVGWLMSAAPQRTVISVVGMGGSGKTTLVANTFNSQIVKKHFDCQAWITVSQTYNIEALLRAIINELPREAIGDTQIDLSSMNYRSLVEMLINYLQGKRYVIVFDDLWDIKFWGQLSVAFPDEALGCRVILTTRNQEIASFSFGVRSHIHHVQPLNEKEAWDLFSMKAFSSWPDSSCPPELQGIARDLIGKCKGLPLGIAALGALMSTKRVESEWAKVYRTLNWELNNNPALEVVKSISLLGFNELPHRLKHCFLYFCIFPEDYVVQCKRLVRLWMAEGFVEQVEGAKPEETAESYLAELTCRCMLQVVERGPSGRAKTFKMHDLLRELALSISQTDQFCTTYTEEDGPTSNESRASRRLSIHANYRGLQAHKDLSKVCTFFTFAPKKANASSSMGILPRGFKHLRVLDVKNVPIVQLPDEIVKFFNLKYLNLRGTRVKELPEGIGNLHNLETLDIRHSKIRLLPIGMVKLQNLRHLLMYHKNPGELMDFHSVRGTEAPFNIWKLKSLEVLKAMDVGGGMVLKQLGEMTQLTSLCLTNVREADEHDLCKSIESLKLIEELDVKTSNEGEVLRLDALPSPPPLLKTLGLVGKLEKVPLWFHSLESLTFLFLGWSRLPDDGFLQHIQALPNLTNLQILNAHIGKELVFHTGFRKLTMLAICQFPQLNGVIIHRGVMPSLHSLEILDCLKLMQLPHGIEHLTCLQTMSVVPVSNDVAKGIRTEGSLDHSKVKHIPDVRCLTQIQFEFGLFRLWESPTE